MADPHPYPGTPGWVKVFGIIVLVVVLLFVILLLTRGPHGPRRHTPFQSPPGDAVATHRPSALEKTIDRAVTLVATHRAMALVTTRRP